ncbi:MAG: hypothetical protein J5879_07175 [Clostridia bacterium]|nr:hypothetical protein [Clostridia bacterium]
MKNDIKLYKAIGNAEDYLVKDALESGSPAKNGRGLRTFWEIAACVAIVCGFVMLSLVLLKLSGPKTPTDGGASSGNDTAVTDDTVTEGVPDMTDPSAMASEREYLTLEEFYRLDPYKDLLPAYFPENYVNYKSSKTVPGEYAQSDGTTCTIPEAGYICLIDDSDGVIEKEIGDEDSPLNAIRKADSLQIRIKGYTKEEYPDLQSADRLSADLISSRSWVSTDPYGDRSLKLMKRYTVMFEADGWAVEYEYTVLYGKITDRSQPVTVDASDYAALDEADRLGAGGLFKLITSAPYFKAHPLSGDTEKENVKAYGITGDDDGLTLSVRFGSDDYWFMSVMDVTATLKNNTDHDITVYIPVDAPDHDSHKEITVSVYRPDNGNVRLMDIDTYNVEFPAAESYMTLKSGEEYVQKMRLTGDLDAYNSVPQGTVEQAGIYNVRAVVLLADENGEPTGKMELEFQIPLGEGER